MKGAFLSALFSGHWLSACPVILWMPGFFILMGVIVMSVLSVIRDAILFILSFLGMGAIFWFLLAMQPSNAQELELYYVPHVIHHYEDDYTNERINMVGIRYGHITAGTYLNSYSTRSYFLGGNLKWQFGGKFYGDFTVAGVTGYDEQYDTPVMPFWAGRLSYYVTEHIKPFYMLTPVTQSVGIAYEHKFK